MIGEDRLRDAAKTIRRLEYELADARRDVRRANDRLEQMRSAIGAQDDGPWEPPTRADPNPLPRLRWRRHG